MTEMTDTEGRKTSAPVEGEVGKAGAMTWYEEFYAALEAKDITVVDRLCTADTTLRFANHGAVEGREAVRATMLHFWGTIGSMRHAFTKVVEDGESAVLEAIVTYTTHDGRSVDVPCATAIDRRGGLVAAQRIYIDLAPLHALLEPGAEDDHTTGGGAS